MPENTVTREDLEARLKANPFAAWMGLSILSLDEEVLEIGLVWKEDMIANPEARNTHGGILAALIDTAADFMIAAKVGRPVPTIDLRIDYHSAAGPGDLRAVARIKRLGRTFSTAEAEILDADGKLIASGRGVYFTAAAQE